MRKYTALSAGIALGFSVLSIAAFAQEGVYFGSSLGYYTQDSKRTSNSDNNSAGIMALKFGYRFPYDWALELSHGVDVFGSNVKKNELNVYYYLGDSETYERKLRTYLVSGVSRLKSKNGNVLPTAVDNLQKHIGFGLSKLSDNNWEWRGDIRGYYGFHGTRDAALTLAVLKHFGDAPAPVVSEPVVQESVVETEPYVAPEPVSQPEVRTITVRLNVEFEIDSDVVRDIYGNELKEIAHAMKAHTDIELVLEGHTDATGSDDYNQSLSERRAKAVKAFLSETYGIDADRIFTVGYGESRPIASNDNAEGRQRNRRVIGEMSYTEVVPE